MNKSILISLALASSIGAGVPALGQERVAPAIARPVLRQSKRQLLRAASGSSVITWGYLKHPAGTVAQAKRAAIKSKNRAKNRALVRRAA